MACNVHMKRWMHLCSRTGRESWLHTPDSVSSDKVLAKFALRPKTHDGSVSACHKRDLSCPVGIVDVLTDVGLLCVLLLLQLPAWHSGACMSRHWKLASCFCVGRAALRYPNRCHTTRTASSRQRGCPLACAESMATWRHGGLGGPRKRACTRVE